MKSILDPTFRYVPSASTDLRKTFARIRRDIGKSAATVARDPKVRAGAPSIVLLANAKKAAQHP